MAATVPIPPVAGVADHSDSCTDDEPDTADEADEDIEGTTKDVSDNAVAGAPIESARESRLAARAAAAAKGKKPASKVSSNFVEQVTAPTLTPFPTCLIVSFR